MPASTLLSFVFFITKRVVQTLSSLRGVLRQWEFQKGRTTKQSHPKGKEIASADKDQEKSASQRQRFIAKNHRLCYNKMVMDHVTRIM